MRTLPLPSILVAALPVTAVLIATASLGGACSSEPEPAIQVVVHSSIETRRAAQRAAARQEREVREERAKPPLPQSPLALEELLRARSVLHVWARGDADTLARLTGGHVLEEVASVGLVQLSFDAADERLIPKIEALAKAAMELTVVEAEVVEFDPGNIDWRAEAARPAGSPGA
ncbi:MAG: hypothetical protein CMN30_04130 [Sandaracinus sp.]|nr:hypothetical protein [Sandaracinus sp.]